MLITRRKAKVITVNRKRIVQKKSETRKEKVIKTKPVMTENMDSQAYADDKESVLILALQCLYRAITIFVRFLLVRVYGQRGQSIPTAEGPLLLEPASSIAEKIRTKQVNIHFILSMSSNSHSNFNRINCIILIVFIFKGDIDSSDRSIHCPN